MEVIVYDYQWRENQTQGQTKILSTPSFVHQLGQYLIIGSFAALIFAASPFLVKEIRYRLEKQEEISVKATFGQITNDELLTKQKQAVQEALAYGVTTDFSLVIPKINAKAKIVPNVHPANKEEYLASLKEGVAHAYGTGFPGGGENIFLFSHSTDYEYNIDNYNAIFYLLKELEPKDLVVVFYAGQKFEYQVSEKQIVEADDTDWITSEGENEQLILQTCWPPGTSLKRLIIVARPIV